MGIPGHTLTVGAYYLNRRGEVMGPIKKNPNIHSVLHYPFKVDDHRIGVMTYTDKGKNVFGSSGLDDLIVGSEGATHRTVVIGECYHTNNGKVVGPIMQAKGGAQEEGFPFYYNDPEFGKIFIASNGGAKNSTSRSLDLTRKGSGPDLPEPVTGYETPNAYKTANGTWKTPKFPDAFSQNHKKTPKKPVPQPKAVKLPPPRRRVININPVRNTIAVEPEGPKWKRLSVYESPKLILALAEVQHIEKSFATGKEGCKSVPNGLLVITGKTTYAFDQDTWMNPVYICEDEKKDFLTQFDAYLTHLENPIIVTEAKPKKKGKDIGKASGVIFESINALIPDDGSFFDEYDDESPF